MNIIIHSYKPYKKWKIFATYWFLTIIKCDVLDQMDNAAKRIDKLLWYNRNYNVSSYWLWSKKRATN